MKRPRKKGSQIVNAERRFETGCIATLSDGVSRHFTGAGAESTRAVADYCDRHGLRVVCISTPVTIYRDLQGHRRRDEVEERFRIASSEKVPEGITYPELRTLAAIGRTDLWTR